MEYKYLKNKRKEVIGVLLAATLPLGAFALGKRNEFNIEKERSIPVIDKLHKESYDLINDLSIKVIKINNKYHLAKSFRGKDLYKFSNKYDSYIDKKNILTYYYIDIFSSELLSIDYYISDVGTEINLQRAFLINEIEEERQSIDYASSYYGIKEYYTYDELLDMIEDLNKKEYTLKK